MPGTSDQRQGLERSPCHSGDDVCPLQEMALQECHNLSECWSRGRIVSALPSMEPPNPVAACSTPSWQPARSSRSSPWPPPGPGRWRPMAAVAEGVAAGVAATAHRHRGRLVQPQLVGDTAGAQVGAIAKPAVMATAAAAELVHASRQVQRLGARGGCCRLGHDGFSPLLGIGPSLMRFSSGASPAAAAVSVNLPIEPSTGGGRSGGRGAKGLGRPGGHRAPVAVAHGVVAGRKDLYASAGELILDGPQQI